ncbi:N-acetylmuramic acid 6-phosphate etherase [Ligilactobacillus salitolerans]|uniref:N-acetylmuramic acid 6-phosphate etherase n=1 Tax=Ligilactobacillus salitolerans TaxID=1808352 RepID=A0A401IVM9_9LACO|nr:N-acetylmuramic acid 6-phosphate etherase [Ligilactobacillus salitolerans]GBG95594.1 N-acetylmuramic acid 6-phosphate etherase [Ligilactobacillus salitolerans]
MKVDLSGLTTEKRNDATMHLDELSVEAQAQLMNAGDQEVAPNVAQALPQITQAVERIVASFNQGGRLIYLGAGTSGRLGVLDAAECVPTFGVSPEMVIGLIAGGPSAMTVAVEGAEDSLTLGPQDLQALELNEHDTVVGIAASGRTPYVVGALRYAAEVGAQTISLACNRKAEISQYAQTAIEVDCGPEFLTGSTRLKAGTAQKLVLNMLSTLSMVGIGKVYNNLMVDVKATNEKLVERAKRIVMQASGANYQEAEETLQAAEMNVKTAIVMIKTHTTKEQAEARLKAANGFVKQSIVEKQD